jgi:Zn-dependent peptidase ImmA (M78 family)
LRTLTLPEPFSVQELCSQIERQRGRPLKLHPLESQGGPFGLLVSSSRADYVFYVQNTTAVHQRHIVLHELCHLLLGHQSPVADDNELLHLLLPDLRPALVHAMLQRRTYTANEEQEAELLASLILQKAASPGSAVRPPTDTESAALLQRLEATLRESSKECQ